MGTLRVGQLGPNLYVASVDHAAGLASLPVPLAMAAYAILDGGAIVEEVGEACSLPAFDAPLPRPAPAELASLKGATVIFADADAQAQFGYTACETLARLGVRRALMGDPAETGAVTELSFDGRRGIGRVLARLRLSRRRVATLANARPARLFGAKRYDACDGLTVSGEVRAIDAYPDVELADRFLVFEGGRQLPPLPAAHAAIRERGDGRHSAWNQQLFFAPTRHAKPSQRYWMARMDERAERLAPVVRRTRRFLAPEALDLPLLDRLVRWPPEPHARLEPGDPIVVCTHALPPGGAERQWVYLAEGLKALGYDVSFVTYQPLIGRDGHYLPLLERAGIPVVQCETLSAGDQLGRWPAQPPVTLGELGRLPSPAHLLPLISAFARLKPKAVLLQLDHPNVVGAIAAHIANVPRVVLSFRNYNPTHFPYLMNDWFHPAYAALSRSPRVLMSGNHVAANADYAEWMGADPGRVAHIPNVIDPEQFPTPDPQALAALRQELGVEPATPVILGVFRLSDEKDPRTFLDVCARALAAVPGARAFIAGMGPLSETLERRIGALGLEGRIGLLGRRADVNALMSVASVFLLTSIKEGMPNVVLEAQLMGVPVVATRCGAVGEIVIDGETALLAEVGDVDALAHAVIALLRDPGRARAMGEAARERVLNRFPKLKLAERYVALIRDSMAPARAASLAAPKPQRLEAAVG